MLRGQLARIDYEMALFFDMSTQEALLSFPSVAVRSTVLAVRTRRNASSAFAIITDVTLMQVAETFLASVSFAKWG
jgi:hypothetical protein